MNCKICDKPITEDFETEKETCFFCQLDIIQFGMEMDEALDDEDSEILSFCEQNNL